MKSIKKIAVITTEYRRPAHADVIVTRWLEPVATDAKWGRRKPAMQIASAYIEQHPENDNGREILGRHGVPIYETIDEVLCLGGKTLAVDAVILIGEHGDYPFNELGQQLYPRKRMFDAIVDVYRRSGKVAPIFCDKHLSWNFQWALDMYNTAKDMGFMLISSSSIPFVDRYPPIELPLKGKLIEAVTPFFGPDESYGYHSFEFVQAIVETRPGGESGIESVTCFRGDDMWRRLDEGRWSKKLLDAALDAVRTYDAKSIKDGDMRELCKPNPRDGLTSAFEIRRLDGTVVTHINLHGYFTSWGIGMSIEGCADPVACAPIKGDEHDFYGHFARMSQYFEDAFLTGERPFDAKRSLITTGLTAAAMRARAQPGVPLETPELHISY
jgi:hypothetical protein